MCVVETIPVKDGGEAEERRENCDRWEAGLPAHPARRGRSPKEEVDTSEVDGSEHHCGDLGLDGPREQLAGVAGGEVEDAEAEHEEGDYEDRKKAGLPQDAIVLPFSLHLRPLPLAPVRAAGLRSRAVAGAP